MQSTFKQSVRRPLQPVARRLRGLGIRPNHVTLAGVLAACGAAVCLAADRLTLALVWMAVSLLCDMLDGDLARLDPQRSSPFGAFLDSSVDRISEAVVFGGLLIGQLHAEAGAGTLWLVLWILALTGSFMVSYARARAEGLGIPCAVGFAERPERMVVLLALIIAGWQLSIWFLAALAVMSWLTVSQRIAHVARAVRQADRSAVEKKGGVRPAEALGP
jgi:CDP-diacylglycerol--glycerol-3-phosphate 3-phosphatidyltransferase